MADSSTKGRSIDPRSIRIRRIPKPLRKYLYILEDEIFYPIKDLGKFDDIFLSFLKEKDFKTCTSVLIFLFNKIEYYSLELANCKIAFNIGKLFDCYLTKFKDQLKKTDLKKLHKIVENISSDSFDLHNLKDTEFVIALVYLKHYDPEQYKEEKKRLLSRLENNEGTDACVRRLIENIYNYPIEELNKLIYFQLRSFVLIKNTMVVTDDYVRETTEMLSKDYRDDWIKIFANKMLSHVIVPCIAYSRDKINRDNVKVDDESLLKWLLAFSEKAFGHRVRPDKWETIYEEDFAITWQFVKEHASKEELFAFYNYLAENGFEFHIADPISENCFSMK